MSKLAERVPALVTREDKMELATSVLDDIAGPGGRITTTDLDAAIEERIEDLEVNETVLVTEGKKSAAKQIRSAWQNAVTIKLDRKQRIPVYQAQFGFGGSYFKVGSEFVPPQSMTVQDFEVMLERVDRRIEGAQTDRAILSDLFDRARPGLEAGQNLVEQFEAGQLELGASTNGTDEIEAGDTDEEGETA